MEEQFTNIEYVLIAPDILVPLTWPIYDLEDFVVKLLRKIISTSQQESPIIRVHDISVRLMRNHPNGFPFVCELVPNEQVIGADIYDIVSSEDVKNNLIGSASGSDLRALQRRTLWARTREPRCVLRSQALE
ncbi:GSCOCT00013119001.2-RA-CDS [Cotesia congregata]|uniref:Cc_bv8.11_16.3 n=2 Tax=root TaxID=1 RepID=S6CWL8_COTCN|nr:GSCOCT00013119001.2-RA-CDS [Cotesia congregata]CAG5092570.1 cc_bv8.11_16.3 [Cotesia congregata]CCB96380.1 hypothetical protein BV8-11 [Bracoviriform congregatae]CCQ71284.1 hypothetical protein BV8-11 [Cotesia congregata]